MVSEGKDHKTMERFQWFYNLNSTNLRVLLKDQHKLIFLELSSLLIRKALGCGVRAQSCGTDLFSLVGALTLGGSGQSWCLLGLSPNSAGATEPTAVLRWPQLLLEKLAWCGIFQWEHQWDVQEKQAGTVNLCHSWMCEIICFYQERALL